MSRRMSACLEAVVCDDELPMDDSLLDEDKLEDTEEEEVMEDELETVGLSWPTLPKASREVTQEELDATHMYLSEIGFSPC
jgi:RNA polymerase nonessential primary-like sigma factor